VRYHAAVLVVAGMLAYAGSLSGPFLFDDQNAVVQNASIRSLSPLSVPLAPPRETPVAGRPIVNLTFAANYAAGGLDVTGYHGVNLAVHLLTALVLFGVVRRTLRLPSMPGQLSRHADGLALACALVWELHPLNTEVVNYVTQRTESLMALCYLLTLYAAIRAHAHPARWGWRVAAIVACALGMASKESMVTAPVMVLLYDRVFLYPSFAAAARERAVLYGGLAATWGVLALLMLGGPRTTVGFSGSVSPWTYLLNQLSLIARYLWLSIWPRSLVLDYGLPRALTIGDVLAPGALVVALGLLTIVALRLRPMLGFLGAWFFVTLAPASSVVPITTEVGAERRMYLPLMAIVVLGVLAVYRLLARREMQSGRVPVAITALICLALAAGTVMRTREYRSVRSIAQANVDRYPQGRARFALAREMVAVNEHSAALAQLQEAIKDYPPAYLGLATEMATSGRMDDAVKYAQEFIRLQPGHAEIPTARDLMGRSLALQGKYELAAEQFNLLAYERPNDPAPRVSMGDVLLRQRRLAESIASYETALRLRPGDPDILGQLGLALAAAGRMSDASLAFGGAVAARPTDLRFLNLWGRTLAAEGRYVDAAVPLKRLVQLAPSDNQARDNLRIMEGLAAKQGGTPTIALP
jgi:protein O-mannosyl-transferase